MDRSRALAILTTIILLSSACAPATEPAPTAPATATKGPTVTASPPPPTPTPRPSPTGQPTATPTRVPTATPEPSPAPTSSPTLAPSPSAIPASAPETLRAVAPVEDVLPGEVRALHASADGALWLITDGGFATLRDTTWQVTRAELGGELAGVDDLGRVWVVSDDGAAISAFHRRQDGSDDDWTSTTYGADAGWRTVASADAWHREIGPVETDGAGRVWLATSQDVRVFDAERWTVLTPAEMGMGEIGPRETWATLTLELAQSSGTVWVGACDWGGPGPLGGQGVRWFEGGSWRGADAPVAAGCATAIAEDRQGRVWMAVDERVWRYTPTSGTWTELAPPEPPMADVRFGFVQAMALDPSGDPWPAMVLCGGASCYGSIALYHVEDGTWVRMGEPLDFGGGLPPHRLIPGTRGVRWIIWAGSLHRVAGEALSEPVTDLGLIRHAVVDDAGRAWFVAPFEGREMLWTLKPSS